MNEIEKRLFKDLSKDTEVPTQVRTVIEESVKNAKTKKKKYSFAKIALTTCACLVLAIGIVYAGTKTYKVVKKEPEKVAEIYSKSEINGEKNSEITKTEEEQKKEEGNTIENNIMSEEEARERTIKILEEYGLENEKIKSIELENNIQNNKIIWKVETENNIFIEFDAKGGKYFKIKDNEK